jgi:hypothetical protein
MQGSLPAKAETVSMTSRSYRNPGRRKSKLLPLPFTDQAGFTKTGFFYFSIKKFLPYLKE